MLAAAVWRYLFLKSSVNWMKWYLIVMMSLMIAFYIYRMARYFPDTPPMTYYQYNLIYRLRCLIRAIVF